jgi:hypothetical protein
MTISDFAFFGFHQNHASKRNSEIRIGSMLRKENAQKRTPISEPFEAPDTDAVLL